MKQKILILGCVTVFSAVALQAQKSLHQPRWAASLDGTAYEISLSKSGKPVLRPVDTVLPVLSYAGTSADGRYRAYTHLDALDEKAPDNRQRITVADLVSGRDVELVPSGDLVLERKGRAAQPRQVDAENEFVIAAAWSPKGSVLAYTYSSGDAFGIAVVDVARGESRVVRESRVLPDHIAWSATGDKVHFYEESGAVRRDAAGQEIPMYRTASASVEPSGDTVLKYEASEVLPLVFAPHEGDMVEQPFYLGVKGGAIVRGDNLQGLRELELRGPSGDVLQRVPADVLIATLPTGVVYKRLTEQGAELSFLAHDGEIIRLVASATFVSYYLPFHNSASSTDTTVTQVGIGYTTAQCNVSSHIGNLAYAYDMQAPSGNEYILVACNS